MDLTPDLPPKTHESPYVGIHLSGANTPKTAVVSLRQLPAQGPLAVEAVYEKIASYGSIFSDERLVEIVQGYGVAGAIFVDAPLTASPCEMCTRASCPGVVRCDDLAVAYMLRLNEEAKRHKRRRKRPLNPQNQRLWDIAHSFDGGFAGVEPTFSNNKSPLVARARALAKRFAGLSNDKIELKETSVPHVLASLANAFPELKVASASYRSFETGLQHRQALVKATATLLWLRLPADEKRWQVLYRSVETFHAYMAALVAALYAWQQTATAPDGVYEEQGWVHVPEQWAGLPPGPSFWAGR